ncbi:UDP-N-acetylglucosamine transferase subunit ALG14 isoform X2 [Cinnamomum micranthum f. kanehirae]|uniref:UDP-N-acetylglucosamine transferase subunit ALG14 n=1 Tax=Cinnamomum micranthum f. kanehirae TaxID=337451 RepID=A0A3S3MZU4_9MAGN|nr:UDP-N-acetylglucosamine transferase subunit ALG14 isoform X2 [Cinnamomum micranthum f. kanehirae]
MENANHLCCPINIILFVISIFVARVAYVLYWSGKPLRTLIRQPMCTLIILGSGGHTAEMLNLVAVLEKDKYTPRFYIAALTDNMSLQKAQVLEESLAHQMHESARERTEVAQFMKIYRSREVGQSYLTSVGTTLVAIVHALWLVFKIKPQVVICNGPGTCIPLCAAAFLLKVVGIKWSYIFYVESIARVKKLSLSGLLLYKSNLADQFFVQWPQLQKKYPKAHYFGCLM